ncbi:hypothetical protein OPT61_g8878 [Boeremia exigua]|uniref:Uncharacterized protein n=1 Tax=Boeremia exigua TaxID=749465 RepID=A0ACC2HX89_9PLEO|nr:hypothetical protein OPT61_g8878 [Boeremia exigua]
MAAHNLSRAARIILVGAPGVGKGTQTERLMKKFPELSSISSGDLLRKNVRERTPLGIQAESKMKAGALVPDSMILRLIVNELSTRGWIRDSTLRPYAVYSSSAAAEDMTVDSVSIPSAIKTAKYTYSDHPEASFILDGFPRTANQAVQLNDIVPINMVVNIDTPSEIIIDRICNRWVHAPSGRVYNTTFNAPKVEGKDDITGEPLTRRADDDPEVWKQRLQSFKENNEPLLEHYDKAGILWTVNGNSSDEITPQLFKEFGKRFGIPVPEVVGGFHSQTSPAPAPASTPPTPSLTLDTADFEDIWADSASEHSDDWLDIAQDSQNTQEIPCALDARAMAEDFSEGRLETLVGSPQKELAGTQNAYVSYLVSTKSDYQSFQKPEFTVRRRFTDFVFLWKQLTKEYPQCAVPPLPDKHKMEYVRGDRFGPDFTQRRAHSLHRFLKRLALHPVLRRAMLLITFLESPDWNQHMKGRSSRAASGSEPGGGGIVDAIAESFVNTFTKVHKPDKRFIEVSERAGKLTEDLNNVEKVTVRVARRQADLEQDYADLATQCQKLTTLEPAVESTLTSFAASVTTTSQGFKSIKEHTDQNYLTSLRDMDAYILALRNLLRTREGKQLDFEALSEYLAKSAADRDSLASQHGAGLGASGFLRSKVEDFRGIDHDQARRQRVRKLEVEIERLTGEVENSKKATEAFDEHTVKEVADFERIKAVEFKDTLGDLADAHVNFFQGTIETWEKFLEDMRKEEDGRKAATS